MLAKNVVSLLGDADQLIVVAASGEADSFNTYVTARLPTHPPDTFHRATRETKQYFFEYLHSLNRTNVSTNHTLGFEHAFALLRNATESSSSLSKSPVLMLYISRGSVKSAAEAKNVLDAIATGQSRLSQPVVISACAVILGKSKSITIPIHITVIQSSLFHL